MAKIMMSHSNEKAICLSGGALKKLRCCKKGMTLVEILIVIAILGIIAVGATPALIEWNKTLKVKKVARDLYNHMLLAKVTAIKEDCDTVVDIDLVAERYQAFLDRGDEDGDGAKNGVLDAGERVFSIGSIAEKIAVQIPDGQFAAGPPGFSARGVSLSSTSGVVIVTREDDAEGDYLMYRVRMSTAGHLALEFSTDSTDGIDGQWWKR